MTARTPIYCWDTSVVIAWFRAESDKPLDDIELVIRDIEYGRANLLVSVTTYCEVLSIPGFERAAETFRKFLDRSNVMQVNVDPRIAETAVQVREAGREQRRNIKTPDAQIIATAINYSADVLHTFDEKLINVSGSHIVRGLRITRPVAITGQQALRHLPSNAHARVDGPHFLTRINKGCDHAGCGRFWGPTRSVYTIAKPHLLTADR